MFLALQADIFVLFQYEELSTISGMPTAPSLTIEEYETIVENCQLGVAEPQKFVIKNPCVLNKLKSFHCIGRAGHLMRFLTWSKNRIYETYDKVFFPFI
jgi:hypothetical protein